MLDGNLQDQGLLIHFSLLALWGQPTSPGLPALPSTLAKTDLNVTWGEGGGQGTEPLSLYLTKTAQACQSRCPNSPDLHLRALFSLSP